MVTETNCVWIKMFKKECHKVDGTQKSGIITTHQADEEPIRWFLVDKEPEKRRCQQPFI